MKISYIIEKKDIAEHYDELWHKLDKRNLSDFVKNILLWTSISFIYLYFFGPLNKSHVILFFIVFITSALSERSRIKKLKARIINAEDNPSLGEHYIIFDKNGVNFSNNCLIGRIKWSSIRHINETENLFQLFTGTYDAIIIPKRSIENSDTFKNNLESTLTEKTIQKYK